ncbi:MAG: thiamine diphosphokinase [candidate division Zixibacteria bacterium]|nr:thiamine diphosphokinase [candidate division Zixibacteria bacterium]
MADSDKTYILFLHHRYTARDNAFYVRLLSGKTTVAVDGGVRFFRKNKLTPDILIGDFDSSPRLSKKYLENIEVVAHPVRKDKTDSQLALELALERGASEIDICGAMSTSELDHTLGNIFLLESAHRYAKKVKRDIMVRLISPDWIARLVVNDTVALQGRRGDMVSLVPLIAGCRVAYSGLDFPAPKTALMVGDSLTLRNRFVSRRARVTVRGRMLIIIGRGGKNK